MIGALRFLGKMAGIKVPLSAAEIAKEKPFITAAFKAPIHEDSAEIVGKGLASAIKIGGAEGKGAYTTLYARHIDKEGAAGAVAEAFAPPSVGGTMGRVLASPLGIGALFTWAFGTHFQDVTGAIGIDKFPSWVPFIGGKSLGAKNSKLVGENLAAGEDFHYSRTNPKAEQVAAIDEEIARIKASLGATGENSPDVKASALVSLSDAVEGSAVNGNSGYIGRLKAAEYQSPKKATVAANAGVNLAAASTAPLTFQPTA
jgi:hypothetical protein